MGTLRKILTTGVGAALMTESGIRNALSDIKIAEYLTQQATRGKEEFARILTREVKKFLEHINLDEEIKKALSGLTIDVEARISLSNPHSKPRPSKAKFTLRRPKAE